MPDILCCLADSSRCSTKSCFPLPTSAVESSLHRQPVLMSAALILPKGCASQKGCSKSYSALKASLSACSHINHLLERPCVYSKNRNICASTASSFMYLELHAVKALDLPLIFTVVHERVLWARVSSDIANRYWNNPHRGHFCRLEDPFRGFSLSSSIYVRSKMIQNTVSSKSRHTVLQRIISPQSVGAGARRLALTAVSLHGINTGSLPLHN